MIWGLLNTQNLQCIGSTKAQPSLVAVAKLVQNTSKNWPSKSKTLVIISCEEFNMPTLPNKARVVIIGGGVIGCSVAYHLTKLGWKDVVLLERKQLTSGTTWHAAGLIAQLRATANMTKLAKYSQELYGELEAETGVSTGFKRVGSITVALTEERREEIYRQAAMARAFGVDVQEITPEDVKARYEHLNIDGVTGAVYLDKDGQGDPANIALALAKGARQKGAQVLERTCVTGI